VHERRYRRAQNHPVERLELDERPQQDEELVGGVRRVGSDAELLREPAVVEQTEDGLRVADVYR
jgi:hypothetical protein